MGDDDVAVVAIVISFAVDVGEKSWEKIRRIVIVSEVAGENRIVSFSDIYAFALRSSKCSKL